MPVQNGRDQDGFVKQKWQRTPTVANYQPFLGGIYFDLPQKLKNKKTVINLENRDND